MKRLLSTTLLAALALGTVATATPVLLNAADQTLDIYFVDVEGGQSTLIKTPTGETLLIDAGFPSDGTFASRPTDPTEARDPQRILTAVHDAGVTRIDYLMVTHFHGDHDGGIVELSQLLPIRAFIDHGAPAKDAEAGVPGTMALFEAYARLRNRTAHIEPKPGDRLPLKSVEAIVVATGGETITSPLSGAGETSSACTGTGLPAQEKTENPRSTGIRLRYGKFRFLDVGDLSGAPLFALTCPRNLVGENDVYLVAHHGGVDAADPVTFKALNPLVAIVNNGPAKGGANETLATLRSLPSIDSWQLHRAMADGAQNVIDDRIANLTERTSEYIKISAKSDGSFTVTNSRTGTTKAYRR